MGHKGSREAQDSVPLAATAAAAQEDESPAPAPAPLADFTQDSSDDEPPAAPEPPPPRPDMALAERRRITGLEEDPKPSISWLHVGLREQDYEERGVVEVTRSTTLGALIQMRLWGPCLTPPLRKSFSNSAAASVTIDELGDYSDPETGLEHHLEGCSDEVKMAMRVAVFRGLHLIFALLERAELHRIIMEDCEDARDRLIASLPQRVARAKKSAKPAAKASKKTKKHSSRR